jgi:hypothetical protein
MIQVIWSPFRSPEHGTPSELEGARQHTAASQQPHSLPGLQKELEKLRGSISFSVRHLATHLKNAESDLMAGHINSEEHRRACGDVIKAAVLLRNNGQVGHFGHAFLDTMGLAARQSLTETEADAICEQAAWRAAGGIMEKEAEQAAAKRRKAKRDSDTIGGQLRAYLFGASSAADANVQQPTLLPYVSSLNDLHAYRVWLIGSANMSVRASTLAMNDLMQLRLHGFMDRKTFAYQCKAIGLAVDMLAGKAERVDAVLAQAGIPPDQAISEDDHRSIHGYLQCLQSDLFGVEVEIRNRAVQYKKVETLEQAGNLRYPTYVRLREEVATVDTLERLLSTKRSASRNGAFDADTDRLTKFVYLASLVDESFDSTPVQRKQYFDSREAMNIGLRTDYQGAIRAQAKDSARAAAETTAGYLEQMKDLGQWYLNGAPSEAAYIQGHPDEWRVYRNFLHYSNRFGCAPGIVLGLAANPAGHLALAHFDNMLDAEVDTQGSMVPIEEVQWHVDRMSNPSSVPRSRGQIRQPYFVDGSAAGDGDRSSGGTAAAQLAALAASEAQRAAMLHLDH